MEAGNKPIPMRTLRTTGSWDSERTSGINKCWSGQPMIISEEEPKIFLKKKNNPARTEVEEVKKNIFAWEACCCPASMGIMDFF